MIYGYARISRPQQNIDRQIRNIKEKYPEAVIVEEAYTGTTIERPKWQRLLSMVKAGDTIIFDSVSRMSRDAEEGFAAYEELFSRGIELVFLKEPMIDTAAFRRALTASVPLTGGNVDLILNGVNAFLLELAREQIKIAFAQAEKEVADLHQRTREGIETARLAGKQIGRAAGARIETKKAREAKQKILQHSRSFSGNLDDTDMCTLAGISRNTLYKYKRELKNGL